METIVHSICLHPGTDPADFERWVREVDYATCPQLPSVRSFHVVQVSDDPAAPVHYVEVIEVTGQEAFAKDMDTPVFAGLVTAFEAMASVVDWVAGRRVGQGYTA